MKQNKNKLEINEILAIGPSISVLMEGYQDTNGYKFKRNFSASQNFK